MANEKDAINTLLIKASHTGARLFRVNTGVGWVGRLVRRVNGTVTLADARPLHAGLCVGGSDVIGWQPVTITPEMVGQTVAVFCAFEAKTKGVKVTEEQQRFLAAVDAAGGRSGVFFTADEALERMR